MTTTDPDLHAQWQALVMAEAKRCNHALLALLHCKRSHPELWAAVNGQRPETKQQQLDFESDQTDRR